MSMDHDRILHLHIHAHRQRGELLPAIYPKERYYTPNYKAGQTIGVEQGKGKGKYCANAR